MNTLTLYKTLLREAGKLPAYNIRMYALRKIRDEFKEKANIKDPKLIEKELKKAEDNLEMIKRQVIIGSLYAADKLIIE
ncbi:protein bcn92 [Condylostylus longicornis]|uniref:protein bcn92 n=1 Tax=Condylostylus longicornis TaxID=2530218 RepID=UPI00244DA459|nr:protein bcn92 [Condylostylus longicornis]